MTALTNVEMNSQEGNTVRIKLSRTSLVFRRILPLVFMTTVFGVLPNLPNSTNAVVLPDLPDSEYADTEVSTNVTMMAWAETTRQFNIILQFDATASNNVQVAFGTDESADGNLSDEETGLTLGWDCGAWFISSDAVTNRFTAAPAGSGVRKEISFQMSLGEDGLPRTLELTEGSTPLTFSGLVILPTPPAWMYSKSWNLLKVIARGTDALNEQVTVKLSNDAVIMLLR
jgi:hypothetical protein